MDKWVVHIAVKILGTVVWETVVGIFKSKDMAKQWEYGFFSFINSEVAEISTLVMPLVTDIPEAVTLAYSINQEALEYVKEFGTEINTSFNPQHTPRKVTVNVPELLSAEKIAANAYLLKAHDIGLFLQEIEKKGIKIKQVYDQYFAKVLVVADWKPEKVTNQKKRENDNG